MDLNKLISQLGYSKGSPFAGNPYLDIQSPEGLIDMSNTPIDLWGIDNKGNKKKMKAGRKKMYQFPGDTIREIPIAQTGKLVNPFGDPRGLVMRNIAESTQAPPILKQDELAKQQLDRIKAQTTTISQGKEQTAAQKATTKAKNIAYVAANPYSKLDEQGNIVPTQYDRSVAGTPDKGSRAAKNDKALEHTMGALEAAGYITGAGQLYSGAKSLLKNKIKEKATQKVLSTSSGMDAVNAAKPGYNSHLFNKQGYVPPTTDPSLMAKIGADNVKNLEDLKYAQDWAKPFGYKIPDNLERIASSDMLTDRTVKGLANRHNTFVRGVSTNWKELEARNPEILRHLEGKGIDWKNNPKQAAEYMATHIPIQTGYGRASLNSDVFNKGMDGLYTSNSIPTAEGYTYGNGYIVKAKRPTNFSSPNRKDWLDKNSLDYHENSLPSLRSFNGKELDELTPQKVDNLLEQGRIKSDEHKKIVNYITESKSKQRELHKKYNISKLDDLDIFELDSNPTWKAYVSELDKEKATILKNSFPKDYSRKVLKTEHDLNPNLNLTMRTNEFFGTRPVEESKKFTDYLRKHPFTKVDDEVLNLGKKLSTLPWKDQTALRAQIDVLQPQRTELYNDALKEYFSKNYPEFDMTNRYAHYIHLGTPGEKILEPIASKQITPSIWKNKSRAHTNTYSKGLSAGAVAGVIAGNKYQKGGMSKQDIYKFLFEADEETKQAPVTAPAEDELPENQKAKAPQEDDGTDLAMQIAMQDMYSKPADPWMENPKADKYSAPTNDKGQFAFNYLMQKGLQPHVAAGIVGNYVQESGNFRDDVIAGTKKGDSGLATGIAQWHPDRWNKAKQWAEMTGTNIHTLQGQLDWTIAEATQRGDLAKVNKARNTEEAANLFAKYYERPKIIDKNRARYAKQYHPYQMGGIYEEIFK